MDGGLISGPVAAGVAEGALASSPAVASMAAAPAAGATLAAPLAAGSALPSLTSVLTPMSLGAGLGTSIKNLLTPTPGMPGEQSMGAPIPQLPRPAGIFPSGQRLSELLNTPRKF